MRKVVLPALLIASHGLAIWLGSQRTWHRGTATPGPGPTPSSRVADVAELQRRVKERRAMHEDDLPFRAEVVALRGKIPPDADVAAMVKAGAGEPVDYREGEVPAEVLAAYSLWLDRDPLAALRWVAAWDREDVTSSFGWEIMEHLKRVGGTKLGDYLRAVPEAREHLITMALKPLLDESDPATRTSIVLGMPRLEDRLDWLDAPPANYEGQLARIRESLGSHGAAVFLLDLSYYELSESQLAEIRSAGFPAAALAEFERRLAEARREAEERKAMPPESSPAPYVVQKKLPRYQAASVAFYEIAGFEDWCQDAAEGRMTPDEVLQRLEPQLPAIGKSEEDARKAMLVQVFHHNPRLALQWLQRSGADVPAMLEKTLSANSDVAGEVRAEIVAQVFTKELPEDIAGGLAGYYHSWHRDDPEAWEASISRLPEGPLKLLLQTTGEEEAGE